MCKSANLFNVGPEEFNLPGDCTGNVTKVNFLLFVWSLFTFLLLLVVPSTCAHKLQRRRWTRLDFKWAVSFRASPFCDVGTTVLNYLTLQTDLLSSSLFPPPLLGKVSCHPLHLLQEIVPVGLWTGSFHQFGKPTGWPLAFLPQFGDALVHLTLLGNRKKGQGESLHGQKKADSCIPWSGNNLCV